MEIRDKVVAVDCPCCGRRLRTSQGVRPPGARTWTYPFVCQGCGTIGHVSEGLVQ